MTTRHLKAAAFCLSALLGLAHAHAAVAQGLHAPDAHPRLTGSGEDVQVVRSPDARGNIVGGGIARVSGSGEDQAVAHLGEALAQPPIFAHVVGGGAEVTILRSRFADRAAALAAAGAFPDAPAAPAALAARQGAADEAG